MSKPAPYRGNEPYIFISYAHKDKEEVCSVLARMQEDGYRVWFDAGIDPGTEWDEVIASHVETCDYFIAFVSHHYLDSENCKDELNYARDLDKKRLLVYLEDVKLPGGMAMRMNRLQSIFKNRYELDEDFYEMLYAADGISAFVSSKSGVDEATYLEALKIAFDAGKVGTSILQRKLNIGFLAANRILDRMTEEGIASDAEGAKPRTLLISREELPYEL